LLENFSKVELDQRIVEYKESDYLTAIRSDIRQTYFQAIETVFEVFFALLPDKDGNISDKIIEKITLSDLPYSKIMEIAQDKDSLNFLDNELIYPDKTRITLGEFIFYFGLYQLENLREKFSESVKAIKSALQILATEFSDRKEYNSYKHGLRILPAIQKLSVCDVETQKEQISWDLKGSMTFYSYDKKTKETSYTTKPFDSDRDIRMTSICSFLIWNMIKFRDVAFNKESKEKDYKFAIPIFSKDGIEKAVKTNVEIQTIKYSIKQGK
jgi:hypothetical protein